MSQKTFAEHLAREYGVEYIKSVPLPVGPKLAMFHENKGPRGWPFVELLGSLMWLATQTRPDIFNAMSTVATYCSAPKHVRGRAAMGILCYVRRTSGFGTTFQRGTQLDLSFQASIDADRQVWQLIGGQFRGH